MKEDRFYRNLFIVIVTILTIYVLYKVRGLLTPVLSALLVAYILYPLILAASRIGIPKGVAIAMVFLAIVGSIVYVGMSLIPAAKHEVSVLSNPDRYKDIAHSRLVTIGQDVSRQLQSFGLIKETWDDQRIIQAASEWIAEQSTFLLMSFGEFAKQAGQFFLIFFFVLVFALLDGDKFYRTIVQLLPNSFFEPGIFILKNTLDLLGYYLRGLAVENLILGLISFSFLFFWSFFSSLTFVLALVISIIIALTNVIRIIGPIIGAVVGILLVLITSTDFRAIFGIISVVLLVQFLDNVVILPLVMKEQVEIHPVMSVLSVLMGGILAGPLGMIIAIPVIGSMKVIYRILVIEMKKFNMDPEPAVELMVR